MTLIPFVVQQHQPKQPRRTTSERIVDVYLCLIRCQLISRRPSVGRGRSWGLATVVSSTCSAMYCRISLEHGKRPLQRTYRPSLQMTLCRLRRLPYPTHWLALPGHEGKLWTVEFDVKFLFGVGRYILVDLGEIAEHGTEV